MDPSGTLRIGIACYPTVGGSGVMACALGEELVRRGHEVHFFSYERPFRLPHDVPRLHFHRVDVNDYGLFKYPDYTLPLSVKMAEVSRQRHLDVMHVHYAVPHATAAVLAKAMLPHDHDLRIVTTLHGTDTTLLGRDPGYVAAIRHALHSSDAVTAVSDFLKLETQRLLEIDCPIETIHNFFMPRPVRRNSAEVRRELGIDGEVLLFHSSNLRSVKRIDLLLEAAARLQTRQRFKLLILAGDKFGPFEAEVHRLGLTDRVIVRERVSDVEDYLQTADLGLFTSEIESFGLSILEGMWFARPSVAMQVGGIPEVIENNVSGMLTPFGDVDVFANTVDALIDDPARRVAYGEAARQQAERRFSADVIVPQYEALYRRICR
ncbi:MAG TPA: N-acetyl-alpha-D-glucosaminyl L-malate synthase BshA [Pirellulales bacterium]